jgi:hypothetical protein
MSSGNALHRPMWACKTSFRHRREGRQEIHLSFIIGKKLISILMQNRTGCSGPSWTHIISKHSLQKVSQYGHNIKETLSPLVRARCAYMDMKVEFKKQVQICRAVNVNRHTRRWEEMAVGGSISIHMCKRNCALLVRKQPTHNP